MWCMVLRKFRMRKRWCKNFPIWERWLRKFRMRNGDAKFSHQRKGDAKFLFSLVQLPSNGYNFFNSAPICKPFEALDSWLPKLRNDVYHVDNGLQEVLQIFLASGVLWISHSMWRFRITMQSCFLMDFFLWSSSLHLLIGLETHSQGLHKVLSHSWLSSMIKNYQKHQN